MENSTLGVVCAVLVTDEREKFEHQVKVIATTGLISSLFSLVGSVSIIFFIIWKRICRRAEVQPLLHLITSDFFLSILWISSSITYFSEDQENVKDRRPLQCFIWQLLTELTHISTFFLTVNYAVNTCLLMNARTERVHQTPDNRQMVHSTCRRRLKIVLYVASWTVPTIIMLPLMVHVDKKHLSQCQSCVMLIDVPRLENPSNEDELKPVIKYYAYMVLALTLSFSMIAILVLYGVTLRLYWKAVPAFRTDQQRRQLGNMQTRITLYILAFIICWGPTLLLSGHKWNMIKAEEHHRVFDVKHFLPLYILQAISAPLQGFLNCLVYGWTRKSFRRVAPHDDDRRSSMFSTPYYDYSTVSTLEDSTEVDRIQNPHSPVNSTPLAL